MKLLCRCDEPWLNTGEKCYPLNSIVQVNSTHQIISNIHCNHNPPCSTGAYWYNADFENMMFDLKNMNS